MSRPLSKAAMEYGEMMWQLGYNTGIRAAQTEEHLEKIREISALIKQIEEKS